MNIDATVTYSAADGLTVANGATAGGIAVTHPPTKEEPWTDVLVTIRTTGQVVIGPPVDPIETNDEARGEVARLTRELDDCREEIQEANEEKARLRAELADAKSGQPRLP